MRIDATSVLFVACIIGLILIAFGGVQLDKFLHYRDEESDERELPDERPDRSADT